MDDLDRRILLACSRGLPVRAVAHDVGISRLRVRRRLREIRRALGARTNLAAVVTAVRRGHI